MQLRKASIGVLLVFGVWHTEQLMSSATESQSEALTVGTEGARYEHRIEHSRFNVGVSAQVGVEGPYERVLGDKGVFLVDTVTGAALVVPTLTFPYPRPLTEDPDEHSVLVREYLVAAGVPDAEVSNMHVTTTMAGGGPVRGGVQLSRSTLLWYTTHLERSLGGIPVEGSFAFAALDSTGQVITEGVYWPAIPASVVSKAQVLKQRLDSANERTAFLARVQAARPDVGNAAGEVKIVHTSAGHHGTFEAEAVYAVVVRSANGGKAQIARFDATGAAVVMADELQSESDSVKR